MFPTQLTALSIGKPWHTKLEKEWQVWTEEITRAMLPITTCIAAGQNSSQESIVFLTTANWHGTSLQVFAIVIHCHSSRSYCPGPYDKVAHQYVTGDSDRVTYNCKIIQCKTSNGRCFQDGYEPEFSLLWGMGCSGTGTPTILPTYHLNEIHLLQQLQHFSVLGIYRFVCHIYFDKYVMRYKTVDPKIPRTHFGANICLTSTHTPIESSCFCYSLFIYGIIILMF